MSKLEPTAQNLAGYFATKLERDGSVDRYTAYQITFMILEAAKRYCKKTGELLFAEPFIIDRLRGVELNSLKKYEEKRGWFTKVFIHPYPNVDRCGFDDAVADILDEVYDEYKTISDEFILYDLTHHKASLCEYMRDRGAVTSMDGLFKDWARRK